MRFQHSRFRGILYGIGYGLIIRALLAMETEWDLLDTDGLMTLTFIVLVPFIIGMVTAYQNEKIHKASRIVALLMPVASIIGVILISFLFKLEGLICSLMAIPIFAVMALIGGYVGIKLFYRDPNRISISIMMLMPLFIAPLEDHLGLSTKVFEQRTSIVIEADAAEVWKKITRVDLISQDENTLSLFQFLGFPRPLEATLDTVVVGGVRIARFDRGLFFTETITELDPLKVLAFSIETDPASIPPSALDEHVMVGGNYFDVLEGRYELYPIGTDSIRLDLTSRFRLSTDFNFYSGPWSQWIMSDIQENILGVIKNRCERSSNVHVMRGEFDRRSR